jgi:hypothetical protein
MTPDVAEIEAIVDDPGDHGAVFGLGCRIVGVLSGACEIAVVGAVHAAVGLEYDDAMPSSGELTGAASVRRVGREPGLEVIEDAKQALVRRRGVVDEEPPVPGLVVQRIAPAEPDEVDPGLGDAVAEENA